MGKLSAINPILKKTFEFLQGALLILKRVGRAIYVLYEKVFVWLRLRLPFLETLVQRHIHNPSTIFIDIAIFILSIYLLSGAAGYYNIYHKKSESAFSETISLLYPMPAVRVNQSYVWSHHFLQRLRFLTTFQSQASIDVASTIPTDAQLREKIIAGLVEDKIVFLEAQNRGVSVSQEELDKSYEQQKKTTENFEKRIHELYGMKPGEFKQVLAERILKEKVKASVLTRVKVRHILTATESAANEAKKQIEGGKVFETAAREFSQDAQTKEAGGDLGYWTKGELSAQIAPGFEEAVFNGEVNKILGPVQSKFGYHIIQVTEKAGNNYQTYEEWYASVKPNYKIKIYVPI